MELQYNVCKVRNDVRCVGQGSKNTEEVEIGGLHYLPAVKVRAGIFA
jgi:hypothetical protein